MSNSIWKTPDQKPEETKQIIFYAGGGLFAYMGWYHKKVDMFGGWLASQTQKWCYVDDLIAQADKAERLQKAVDNSREKLAAFMHDVWGNWFAYQLNNSTIENLQRWGIQSNIPYSSLTETDKGKDRKFADKIIEIIKDEIKQLIKGE